MTVLLQVPQIAACLGDSLTLSGTGVEFHSWPARLDVNPNLFPQAGVANYGKSGDQSSGFHTRYFDQIKGNGFKLLTILGCINDVTSDILATASWANIEPIVDDAIAAGVPVVLISTSPFGSAVDWSAPRQTQLLALRALFAAKAGVIHLDLYTLMADPLSLTHLNPLYDYGDGKHFNAAGGIFIASLLEPIMLSIFPPLPAPPPAPDLGVTKALVLDLAPELNDPLLTDNDWNRTIGWAGDETSSRLGSTARKNRAETFLVAHMMTQLRATRHGQTTLGMGQGAVTGVTAGQVNKTFAVNQTWADLAITAAVLATTIYGREYLRLIRIFLGAGAGTVAGGLGPVLPRWPNG